MPEAILLFLIGVNILLLVGMYFQYWAHYNEWYDFGVKDKADHWYFSGAETLGTPGSRAGYRDGWDGSPRKRSLFRKAVSK